MKSYSSSCVIAMVLILFAVDLASKCDARPITCPGGTWGDDCPYPYPGGIPRGPPVTNNPTPVAVPVPVNPTPVVVPVPSNPGPVRVPVFPCPQPWRPPQEYHFYPTGVRFTRFPCP